MEAGKIPPSNTPAWGPAVLILSVIIAATTLALLRLTSPDPEVRLAVLGVGNLFSSSLLLWPIFRRTKPQGGESRDWLCLFIWSTCYCVAYGLFTWHREMITLSCLIVAQALAPIGSVFIAGRNRETMNISERLGLFLSVTLLLTLAWISGQTVGGAAERIRWMGFALLLMSFLGSNTAARVIAARKPPSWTQPRFALLNGVCLLLVTMMISKNIGPGQLVAIAEMGLAASLGILSAQWLFLVGLQNTTPFISALCISMAVPISIALDASTAVRGIAMPEILLSALFCGSVLINQQISKNVRQISVT